MLNIILNIIGIIIIFYALTLIKKDGKRIKDFKEDLEMENFLEGDKFSEILKNKINTDKLDFKKINEQDLYDNYNFLETSADTNKVKPKEETIEDVSYGGIIIDETKYRSKVVSNNERIIEMNELGYTKEEIAKKTGRSIREIEVILKLYL